jgi:hypothetical protein
MRVSFVIIVLVLVALAGAAEQPCGVKPNAVPLDAPMGPGGTYVRVSAGGGPLREVQVDTGSVGLVLWRGHVGGPKTPVTDRNLEPYIYYNSSGRAMCGSWVYASVEIADRQGPKATIPQMPVLAVDKICVGYPPGNLCGCATPDQPPVDLGMLGVGFDRGFSMGGPPENPFLELPQMKPGGTMQRGYIITTRGITLGMLPADIEGFHFVGLNRRKNGDWEQAQGCVSIAGGGAQTNAPVCGSILMDTGVDRMYLTYLDGAMPSFRPPLPADTNAIWQCCGKPPRNPACEPGKPACRVNGNGGATVTVSWPDATNPRYTYVATAPQSFVPTGASPIAAQVHSTSTPQDPNTRVFVNTSRQLLNAADYLYDATCGRVGFRPKP